MLKILCRPLLLQLEDTDGSVSTFIPDSAFTLEKHAHREHKTQVIRSVSSNIQQC